MENRPPSPPSPDTDGRKPWLQTGEGPRDSGAPPSDSPPSGKRKGTVRDPRERRFQTFALDDPRPKAHLDLLALNQRLLKARKAPKSAPADETSLTDAHYRYTKAPSVINENLGYGEQVEEVFWRCDGDQLVEVRRVSRLTRTGRQVLPQHTGAANSDEGLTSRSQLGPKTRARTTAK